jgi:hydrogenase/urease accessory protein HupE
MSASFLRSHLAARLLGCLLLLCAALGLNPAQAHEMTIAELTVRESATGSYFYAWGVPAKVTPVAEDLSLRWPEGCEASDQSVSCGPQGLYGQLEVEGLGKVYSAVLLRVHWRSGENQVITLTSNQPRTRLFGGAKDERGAGEIASAYSMLGVQHILSGYDHLLFVISLLMLVGFRRRLVMTITAFTVAHSLTLGASALGWLTLRSAPVEATIALSILLICGEALRQRETLSRRWPSLIAFLFGLLHGLGFAGALREIGLPEQHFAVALLTFNLGVEAGQLLVVLAVWLLTVLSARLLPVDRFRQPLLYATGAMAAFWSIERLSAIFY